MDREDRRAVIGTWPRHERPHQTHTARDEDPPGWRSHHQGHRAERGRLLTPPELVEAIRARAQEIYEHRLHAGLPGTAVEDWLQAEREIMPRQAEIAGGQGPHPAVPPARRGS